MSKLDISAIAGASVVAAACAFPVAAAPVKIGLVETLSGPQASSGQAYRAAVRFAVDRINQAGGWNGEPVQLLEYDNQGGPAGAADKLKAAAADGVHLIVQGASSARLPKTCASTTCATPARRWSTSTWAPKRWS